MSSHHLSLSVNLLFSITLKDDPAELRFSVFRLKQLFLRVVFLNFLNCRLSFSLEDHKVLKRAELGRIAAPFPAREVKNENAENIKHAFKSNTVRQAVRPDTANQTHPGRLEQCRVQAGRGIPSVSESGWLQD